MVRKIVSVLVFAMLVVVGASSVNADGMMVPPIARYIDEVGQKAVIWHDGKKETLILSTSFRGDADEFAWLIPVPSKPEVTQAKDELFTSLEEFTRPKTDSGYPVPMYGISMNSLDIGETGQKVTVLETKKVDIYDIAILEATDGKALREWLVSHEFEYPTNKDFLLQYYITKKWYFVAAKVSNEAMGYVGSTLNEGHATPLAISFDSEAIVYPLKISGPGSKFNEADKIGAFGFEQGQESWYGGTVTADVAYQGTKSYKLAVRSYDNYNYSYPTPVVKPLSSSSAYRTVTGLRKNTTYTLSAYVYAKQGEEGEVQLRVTGGSTTETSEAVKLSSIDGWKRIQVQFTPYSDNNSFSLNLQVNKAAGGVEVLWDGVQLEKGQVATEFKEEVLPKENLNINANQSTPIVLYVFAGHKKFVSGFNTEYAGYVSGSQIEKFAVNDDGKPWMKTNKKMYLTKMTRYMTPAQMTDDLILRDATDNESVGGGSSWLDTPIKAFFILGIPVILELSAIGYFWYIKSKKRKE